MLLPREKRHPFPQKPSSIPRPSGRDEINADRFSVIQIFPKDNHTTVSSKVQSLSHSNRCIFAASLPPSISCVFPPPSSEEFYF